MNFAVHSPEPSGAMGLNGVFLLLVVIGVIVLLLKGSRGVRIGVGVTFGALVLLALVFVFFARTQLTDRQAPGRNIEPRARVVVHDALESGSGPEAATPMVSTAERAWPEGNANLPLEANIYPSPRSAAIALANAVGAELAKDEREKTQSICVQSPEGSPVASAFLQAVRNAAPGANIDAYPREGIPSDAPILVRLRCTGSNGREISATSTRPPQEGRVTAEIGSSVAHVSAEKAWEEFTPFSTRSASWVRKPWVEDMAGFLGGDPQRRQSSWFVGYSDATCSSEGEALDQAYRRAADKLLPQTMEAVLRRTGGQISAQTREELRRTLQQAVRSEPLLADVFTQSFTRPYGTVYRSAVLVNGSRNDRLVAQFSSQFETRRSSWWRTTLSLAGLGVLLVLVYLFLNVVTKGYYRWTLRLSVLGAIVFVLLLLAICS